MKLNKLWFWWIGVPMLIALIIVGPYWIWQFWHHVPLWWRIPVLPQTIFDLHAYLSWFGQNANGLPIGGSFRILAGPLAFFPRIVRGFSIPEAWMVTQWISMVASLWIGSWMVRLWSGLSLWQSRRLWSAFWIAIILLFGLRPGAYSWYLPFGLFSLLCGFWLTRALGERRFLRALLFSVAGLSASVVYSWFLLHVLIWYFGCWGWWLLERSRRLFLVACGAVSLMTAGSLIIFYVCAVRDPFWQTFFDHQFRLGIAFTHIPPISQPLIGALAWLALLVIFARFCVCTGFATVRLFALTGAWGSLVAAWLSTFLTGLYFHNDHFRTAVVILAWVSLAVIWHMRDQMVLVCSKRVTRAFLAIGAVAVFFLFRIVVRSYAFNHDQLETLHLTVWFSLVFGILLLLIRRFHERWRWLVLFLGVAVIGILPWGLAVQRSFVDLPALQSRVPLIEWIRAHVPVADMICADPNMAGVLAPFTGHKVFPSEVLFYNIEPSRDVFFRLTAFVRMFDVPTGERDVLLEWSSLYEGISCHQYPWLVGFGRRFGVADVRLYSIIGCPREALDGRRLFLQRIMEQKNPPLPTSQNFCDWIVTDPAYPFWRLPSGMTLRTELSDGIRVYGR